MASIGDIDLPPLSTRSVLLSMLLGTVPPVLPVRSLVGVGRAFGLADGTVRTALSRMVAAGELAAEGGRYRLVGPLLARQAAQELGRRPPPARWDGRWHVAVVVDERRDADRRRAFRAAMTNARFGELRPQLWLRPANLPAPEGLPGVAVVTGPLQGEVPVVWDLAAWAAAARRLRAALERVGPGLAERFTLAAAVLRHLRADPLLPPSLVPDDWPGDELRRAYDGFEAAFRRDLTAALRASRPAAAARMGR